MRKKQPLKTETFAVNQLVTTFVITLVITLDITKCGTRHFGQKNKKRAFDFQLVMKFVITLVITKIKAAFYLKTAHF